jgi:hypothetical protein
MAAIAEGRITPTQGEALSRILTSHAQTFALAGFDLQLVELQSKLDSYQTALADYNRELQSLQERSYGKEGSPDVPPAQDSRQP